MNIKSICKHGHPREPGSGKSCPTCHKKAVEKWNKTHLGKMAEAAARWRENHREKFLATSRATSKDRSLKYLYGIKKADVEKLLARQHGRCLGCQEKLVLNRTPGKKHACVDHDHQTDVVRGILCPSCNFVLGAVVENPETLRRLIAYLTYDRSKFLIYLAGSMRNRNIVKIANFFRAQGYDVFEDWNYVGPKADDEWQKHEKQRGRGYIAALQGRAAQNVFLFDKAYLDLADAVIVVSPCGKSAFMELGYTKGMGKPVFVLLPRKTLKRFEVMTKFSDGVFETKEEVLQALQKKLNGLL